MGLGLIRDSPARAQQLVVDSGESLHVGLSIVKVGTFPELN